MNYICDVRDTAPALNVVNVKAEEALKDIADTYKEGTKDEYIDILAKTQQEMRFSHHTKIYLET